MGLAHSGLEEHELHALDPFGVLQRREPESLRLIREVSARACDARAALDDMIGAVQELARLVEQGEHEHLAKEADQQ